MRKTSMFNDLRAWPSRRRIISSGVATVVMAALVIASGLVAVTGGTLTFPGDWWAIPAAVVCSILIGLVIASYFGTPIGADATLCDTRWPALGLIAIFLATDSRTVAPMLTGVTRPVVAIAALVLLIWALRERLMSEHRAIASPTEESPEEISGEVCTTCRPLFPTTVLTRRPSATSLKKRSQI
jgi:hypothetical protein